MSRITLSEALDLVNVSRSKLYQDASEGIISTEKNKQGKKVVDIAELERVYGKLRNPEKESERSDVDGHGQVESSNGQHPSSNGSNPHLSESVHFLETQVSMLETQLTQAAERERALITEKEKLIEREDKLVEMLSIEQEKTRQLMLPAPEDEIKPTSMWKRIFRFT